MIFSTLNLKTYKQGKHYKMIIMGLLSKLLTDKQGEIIHSLLMMLTLLEWNSYLHKLRLGHYTLTIFPNPLRGLLPGKDRSQFIFYNNLRKLYKELITWYNLISGRSSLVNMCVFPTAIIWWWSLMWVSASKTRISATLSRDFTASSSP